jgi:alanine-glyoxylate transaminase / serine-glyoxylate transaminase / serine-pyruvate transaminase
MALTPFAPPRRTLMGPGPSDVSPRVLAALARPTIGHLDPAFIGLMDEIKALLQYAFQTENALTMPISGPGTAGMEACVVNLVEPGTEVVVCENGVFGGRLRQMVERAGGTAVVVQDEWGRAVTPEKVEAAFRDHPRAEGLAFVHAETSTGARSDADALCAIARERGAFTIVDTVTSLGGIPVDVEAWEADAVYSGTQKCLSCVPGLAPVTFSDRAVERVQSRQQPVQSWFLDVSLVVGYWGEGRQRAYHHTAPINSLYGLHEALLLLREEGLRAAWARHEAMHGALRGGLEALGLSLTVPEGERLPQLNAVAVPEGIDEARVRQRLLEERGLEIGAGLGALAGKVWRIGLMGYGARPENVRKCIGDLGTVLTEEELSVDRRAALDLVADRLAEIAEV